MIGLLAYYARWIPHYSDRVKPLVDSKTLPLSKQAISCFEDMRKILAEATLKVIDETQPFTVETDASNIAISAILHQGGRPVAFFSRTLNSDETRYSSVEKEAAAIVKGIRKWSHFLLGRHFTLITDQNSVAFMFDHKRHGKVKNDKIMRWRLELAQCSYDIVTVKASSM